MRYLHKKTLLIIAIVAIILGAGVYATINQSSQDNGGKTTASTATSTSTSSSTVTSESSVSSEPQSSTEVSEELDLSNSDETPEELLPNLDKNSAVLATTEMLKELQKSPDGKSTLAERMEKVSGDNFKEDEIFTEAGWNYIYLSDFMSTDPRGKKLTAQSLLSVIHSIEENDNKDLNASDVDYSGVVYLDPTLKAAYIPVDLYTNAATNLSFEMVFINGEWKLQPYTLISQIALKTVEATNAETDSSN